MSNANFELVEVSEAVYKQFSNASQETYFQENTGDKHILTNIRYSNPSKKEEAKKERNTGLEPPPAAVASIFYIFISSINFYFVDKRSAQKDTSMINKLVVKKLKSIYLSEVNKLREKLDSEDLEGLSDKRYLYKYGLSQLELYLDRYKRKNMDERNEKIQQKIEDNKKEFKSYQKGNIELPVPLLPEKFVYYYYYYYE